MVRNLIRCSDLAKLYCVHVIPLYSSVMLILRWCYNYIFLLIYIYIWIDKSYGSDDLPLTQMFLQRNTEVNDEEENAEYKEDDANFLGMSDEGENEGKSLFVLDIKYLH